MKVNIHKPFKTFSDFNRKVAGDTGNRIRTSIRLQLILVFSICLIFSILATGIGSIILQIVNRSSRIDYTYGVYRIDTKARDISYKLSQINIQNKKLVEEYLNQWSRSYDVRCMIVDLEGNVLAKSDNISDTKVDIYDIIDNAINLRASRIQDYGGGECYSFYPVSLKDARAYVIVRGIPEPRMVYVVYRSNPILSIAAGIILFIILFLILTRGKMDYIEELAQGLLEISRGNLSFRVRKKGHDELRTLADNINYMAGELEKEIDEERRAERTKNELITNVSHDLKTPLTSIMGYLRIIKDERYESEEKLKDYIDIAYGKSEKLKLLIDDLFEYTKLTDCQTKLNKQKIYLNELLSQLIDELVPIFEENGLSVVQNFPPRKVMVDIDGDKMVRVFENLLTNAIRYSDKPGIIDVGMIENGGEVIVSLKNKGETIPENELSHVFDRFYRVEKSRSSDTGGSGLGLAIAKNIVELHDGKIWAESNDGQITFYVSIPNNSL